MRHSLLVASILACVVAFLGCEKEAAQAPQPTASDAHDHAGHDHADHDHGQHEATTAVQEAGAAAVAAVSQVTDAAADAVASNAKCPIGGEPVQADGKKVVFNGKVYGFCCDDCIDEFKKDPAKHVASLQ